MNIGFLGLGKMGHNLVLNLLDHNQKVVVYNRTPEKIKEIAKKGAIPTYSLEEFTNKLSKPKVIWLMISSNAVEEVLKSLVPYLSKGDIIIDGGNSFYKNSIRRHKELKKKGINFLDIGVSGGIQGARHGASLMIGGEKEIFKKVEFILKNLAVKDGYSYLGNPGSGHFIKMVHNGIEYGMVGAISEGIEALKIYEQEFNLNLQEITKVYANGSIIEGKLTKWLHEAYTRKGFLESISCEVPKGETEDEMKELEKLAPMPILHQARLIRVNSRKRKTCSQVDSALRNIWGGHKTIKR